MTDKMVWKGFRKPLRDTNLVIFKLESEEFWANLPLYLKEVNHSPTGFEWGYLGSGPSQLAYAILRSYFVLADKLDVPTAILQAKRYYMDFKQDFVAHWGSDEWEITSDKIKVWLVGERAR